MENNNKISISLNTLIMIVIFVVALIIGIVCYFVFSRNDKKVENSPNNTTSFTSNVEDNSSTNINSNINTDLNTNKIVNDDNSSNTMINTKNSTKNSPLPIGEWGIASKYNSKDYVNVPVKVNNVIRGTEAAQRVKDYCNNGSIYKYEDPEKDTEWAVIEYTVDLSNIDSNSSGKYIKVDSKIAGTGTNSAINYNGFIYSTSTLNMTTGYSKDNIATGYFATQLPIGCNDYLIVLGSSSHTQAFFSGK